MPHVFDLRCTVWIQWSQMILSWMRKTLFDCPNCVCKYCEESMETVSSVNLFPLWLDVIYDNIHLVHKAEIVPSSNYIGGKKKIAECKITSFLQLCRIEHLLVNLNPSPFPPSEEVHEKFTNIFFFFNSLSFMKKSTRFPNEHLIHAQITQITVQCVCVYLFNELVSASAPFIQLLICKFDLKRHTRTRLLWYFVKWVRNCVQLFRFSDFIRRMNELDYANDIICLFLVFHAPCPIWYLVKISIIFQIFDAFHFISFQFFRHWPGSGLCCKENYEFVFRLFSNPSTWINHFMHTNNNNT